MKDGIAKYGTLGNKHEFRGPVWIGDTDLTIERILKCRFCVLVEGPFDLVACRLLADIPVLTTGTKSLNEQHFAALRMLGVERLHFLFDMESTELQTGAGEIAMAKMSNEARRIGFQPRSLACPDKDPSACLERYDKAIMLTRMLSRLR